MHLRYDYQTASQESGISQHAQLTMKDLGITYQHSTPQSISAEFWFWNCENVSDTLPPYLKELTAEPLECIGYGLSKEDAEKIRNYKPATL